MPYDYDYFISYAHADNIPENDKSGFVDEFVEKLKNDSEDHQKMFGGEIKVFFDKSEIHNMSDWDNRIRSALASSRFLIVLLSPGYFKSEYCAREFDWWMKHEMHRRLLVEGTTPMIIVDLTNMYNPEENDPDDVRIRLELKSRFPNWFSQIQEYRPDPPDAQFDLHDLDRTKISDALEALRKEAKEKVQRQNDAEKSPNNALYPRYNENFVGRRENLRSLRHNLSAQDAVRFAALTGLGGFGKTELALTYGHAFAWDYQLGRVFANCENQTSLTDILLSCGIAEMNGWELPQGTDQQKLAFLFNHLKAKQNIIVQHNLAEGNLDTLGAHILLILDNVDNLELISQENLAILPDYFHVIITTRENLNQFPYIHSELVDQLSEAESVELLSDFRPFGSDESEIDSAHQIAQSLDGFTLVVELTGAYLARNPDVTYQQQYERLVVSHPETFQVMADRTRRLTRHSADTVAVVLESTLLALSDNAHKALDFAALMAPDAVGFGWLPELIGLDENEGKIVLKELSGYSLLTPLKNESNIARIHRLVAETVKQEIPEEAQKEIVAKIREKCETLLDKDKTFWFTSVNSWNITPVSEFCLVLAEQWTVETSEEDIDWNLTWALDTSGKILNTLGKINETRAVFQLFLKVCDARAKTFPSNLDAQRDLSVSYNILGDLENAAGNAAAARDWYDKGLEICQRLADLAPDNFDVQRNLSALYGRYGDLEKAAGNAAAALEWYEKALEIHKRLAEKMPDNVDAQRDLSFSYERLGNWENAAGNVAAAREWYEKSLEIDQRLAEEMPDNVEAQRDLSVSYNKLGDLEKAAGNVSATRECYEKTLEIRKRLADKMPEDVGAQRDLSVSYGMLGDLENVAGNAAAARERYEKTLEIDQRILDLMPNDVQVQRYMGTSYSKLGDLERAAGNVDAAWELYEKDLKITKQLAEKMPENVDAQRDLGVSFDRLGDLENDAGNADAAREWYEKSLEIAKQLAEKMPENVDAQRDLSISYERLGDLENEAGNADAARDWYEKILDIAKQLAEKTPDNVDVQRDLSVSYGRLGDLENAAGNAASARVWYEKTLKIAQRLSDLMSDNVDVQRDLIASYNNLGDLENDAGNAAAAREWFEKALEIAKQLTEKMPDNVDAQRDLSFLYNSLGDLENDAGNSVTARELYDKALKIDKQLAEKMPGSVDAQWDLSISYERLGDVEAASGNNKAALGWYEKALEIFQQLVDILPENAEFQNELIETQEKLAQAKKQP